MKKLVDYPEDIINQIQDYQHYMKLKSFKDAVLELIEKGLKEPVEKIFICDGTVRIPGVDSYFNDKRIMHCTGDYTEEIHKSAGIVTSGYGGHGGEGISKKLKEEGDDEI